MNDSSECQKMHTLLCEMHILEIGCSPRGGNELTEMQEFHRTFPQFGYAIIKNTQKTMQFDQFSPVLVILQCVFDTML